MSATLARRALLPLLAPLAAAALAAPTTLLGGCRRPPPVTPPPPAPTIRDSGGVGARTFDRLRELAGNWLAGELPVTFEVISPGNVMVQRGGFFVVWHPDGNSVAATVFADEGYRVQMRTTRIADEPSGELVLELATVDTGNIVPDEPIARALTMTVAASGGQITQRWSFGQSFDAPPREIVLSRMEVRPAQAPPTPPSPSPSSPPPGG